MRSAAFTGFVSGGLTMGYLVAALFFVRFWTRARERLFLAFAAAFGLMALAQGLQVFAPAARDWDGHVYWTRLAAFVVIILAILLKNRPRRWRR